MIRGTINTMATEFTVIKMANGKISTAFIILCLTPCLTLSQWQLIPAMNRFGQDHSAAGCCI